MNTEVTRQTLRQFIERHGITMEASPARENPAMRPDTKATEDERRWYNQASHWTCTFKRREPGLRRSLTVGFSQGSGVTRDPDAEGVMECLLSDAAGVENANGFEAWCAEY